jgi:hypothetical protein
MVALQNLSGPIARKYIWWAGYFSILFLNFDVRLVLGDSEISPEEAQRLLQESEGRAFIKNKWVTVDSGKLKQTLNRI